MRSARRTILALCLVVLVAGCADDDDTSTEAEPTEPTETAEAPDTAPSGDAEAPRQIERHVFDAVNAEREARGIPPYEWSEVLAEDARGWSATMAERGVLEHEDIEAVLAAGEGLEAVGENVFFTNRTGPAGRIHVGWMESDGHRRNVLEPGFDRIGIGVVCTADGELYATQRFGRAAASDLPRPGDEIPPPEPFVGDPDGGPSC